MQDEKLQFSSILCKERVKHKLLGGYCLRKFIFEFKCRGFPYDFELISKIISESCRVKIAYPWRLASGLST